MTTGLARSRQTAQTASADWPSSPPGVTVAVGFLLGLAAALIGVNSPSLPGDLRISFLAATLAFMSAVLGLKREQLLSFRPGLLDGLLLLHVLVRIALEYYNDVEYGFAVPFGSYADYLGWLFAWFAVRLVVRSTADSRKMLLILASCAVPVAAVALMQLVVPAFNGVLLKFVDAPSLASRITSGWSVRGTGTIGQWTFLGAYLVWAVAVFCCFLSKERNGRRNPSPWLIAALAFLLLGQFSTLTFAPILISVVIVISLLWQTRNLPAAVGLASAGAAAGWLLFGTLLSERIAQQTSARDVYRVGYGWLPESVRFRMGVWINETIPTIKEHLWTGWGTGVYERVGSGRAGQLVWVSPESEWLRSLVSGGLILFASQVLLLGGLGMALWRVIRTEMGRAYVPVIIAFLGCLLHGSIAIIFSGRGMPLLMYPVLAAIVSIRMVDKKS